MNNLIKYGLIALGLGGIYYLAVYGKQAALDYAGKISFSVLKFGKPTLKGGQVTVPLDIRITNPTLLMAPIQSVSVKLFFLRNGMYTPFASTLPTAPFQIKAKDYTDVSLYPTVDLAKLNPFTGGVPILTQVTTLVTGANPLIDVKAEITTKIEGYEIVKEVQQKIYLHDFLKNVA